MKICSVCRSPRRGDIDRALLAGDPVRDVAAVHGCSKSAISRHQAEHLPARLVSSKFASEISSAAALLHRLDTISEQTQDILREARESKDGKLSLRAIARLERQVELMGRMVGLIQEAPIQVNVMMSPEWVELRTKIVAAVMPHPEAAAAVLAAIGGAEDDAIDV